MVWCYYARVKAKIRQTRHHGRGGSILTANRNTNLCTEGFLEHTIRILEEYPDLILLLNACLPPGYSVEIFHPPLSLKYNLHNYLIQNPDGYKEEGAGKWKQA